MAITIEVRHPNAITAEVRQPNAVTFNLGNIIVGDRLPNYTGSYIITPRVTALTLDTDNKSMIDDITCLLIPLAQVQNPQGGITATIG